jgi:hypothetical protein
MDETSTEYIISGGGRSKSSLATDTLLAPTNKVQLAGHTFVKVHLNKQSGWYKEAEITSEMKGDFIEFNSGPSLLIPTIIRGKVRCRGYEMED